MKILVLADTHRKAGGAPLPAAVLDALPRVDLVPNAGDVTNRALLDDGTPGSPTR